MAERQIVIFGVGKEEYGLPISSVREIIEYSGATKVPRTPDSFEGIINLRGNVLPVLHFGRLMGLPSDKDAQAVVIDTSAGNIGIVVDEVREVAKVSDEEIEQPGSMMKDCVGVIGIVKMSGRLVALLDSNLLATPGDIDKINEAIA